MKGITFTLIILAAWLAAAYWSRSGVTRLSVSRLPALKSQKDIGDPEDPPAVSDAVQQKPEIPANPLVIEPILADE